jgi:hypothetical protein
MAGTDPLQAKAAQAFAAELTAGHVPSVRAIRAQLHMGQARAQRLRAYRTAWQTPRNIRLICAGGWSVTGCRYEYCVCPGRVGRAAVGDALRVLEGFALAPVLSQLSVPLTADRLREVRKPSFIMRILCGQAIVRRY